MADVPGHASEEQRWTVYDGRPESGSDGVPVVPAPTPRPPRRWPWALCGAAALAGAVVVGSGPVPPDAPALEARQADAGVAPSTWNRVDASLTSGLVVVQGAAEADGIVLTPGGLVATSLSRISGDSRRPADGSGLYLTVTARTRSPRRSSMRTRPDIALVEATGFVPATVARPGTAVHVGETLTLLDEQGGRQPILGIGVTVTGTDQTCSRAGSTAHPQGFRFSLAVATAEPGAALVRADGTVVGLYFGGDDATHHCAIPIADVMALAAG